MADFGVINNKRTFSFTSTGGHLVGGYLPSIALAFGFCKVVFDGDSYVGGQSFRLTMGDYSIDVTLDTYGKGEVSLLPFIRVHIASQGVQNLPLKTDASLSVVTSAEHNYFTLEIKDLATGTTSNFVIYYIYGTNVLEYVTDKYINLNTGDVLGTWQTLEYYANNNANGTPVDADNWRDCNYNLNRHIADPSQPTQLAVTIYRGSSIVNTLVTYHFIEDCRVANMRAVKWLDSRGGVNIRKLTFAGENLGAVKSNAYNRPQTDLNISNGDYYCGDDKWETLQPARTITLGDDSIPNELYDWLKELVTSPVVELWSGAVNGAGKWLRCNLGDVTLERDPRKNTFSLTLSLAVPAYAVQQF